jgi:KUP system potassium uptake protein
MAYSSLRNNHSSLIAALGVVYGDIGTSPLYAIKECFLGAHMPVTEANVLGVLSLIFWSLILVVTVKYVLLMLKANNHGEGGILALLALVSHRRLKFVSTPVIVMIGLLGAALFWGDSLITPAISVLSALEGLSVAAPNLVIYVMPLSVVIILLLFVVQKKGTEHVGKIFGPVMLLWFLVIGVLGLWQIIQNPIVLKALNPLYCFKLIGSNPLKFLVIISFVVLCVTGAEALYADMGHFGIKIIRCAWLFVVLPCLFLNYFGQGAAILSNAANIQNPFYAMVPSNWLLAMIVLATIATIIASQAVISGMFSLCHQAIQLEYLPLMKFIHTSAQQYGRIYIPFVNWILCAGVIAIILFFKDSQHLASAYGFAVSGVMVMTSLLAMVAMRRILKWSLAAVIAVFGCLLLIDATFFLASAMKFTTGGWLPACFALVIWLIMQTWNKERRHLNEKTRRNSMTFSQFFQHFNIESIQRIKGTAVFLSKDYDHVPYSLIKHIEHANSLPQQVIILSILVHNVPYIPKNERVFIQHFNNGFKQIVGHFGFMQIPKISSILRHAKIQGLDINLEQCHFVLLHAVPYSGLKVRGIKKITAKLFKFLLNNSTRASYYFEVPAHRTIELGIPFKVN